MSRHAYMIMAHANLPMLKALAAAVDDPRNDIYLHISTQWRDFDPESVRKVLKHSNMFMVERENCFWGGDTLIWAELNLIRAAASSRYSYYHLISGADIPIKTQDEIHEFFDENAGKEFVHFCKSEPPRRRAIYYHPLHRYRRNKILGVVEKGMLFAQAALGVNRWRHIGDEIKYGWTWFSITDAFARYVIQNEAEIRRRYRMTGNCDEIFMQTLIWNSDFRKAIYHPEHDGSGDGCMRLVDFSRGAKGSPYTFRIGDYDKIVESKYLFARKFDQRVDAEIVRKLYARIGVDFEAISNA